MNYDDAGLEQDQDLGSSFGADCIRYHNHSFSFIFGLSFSGVLHYSGKSSPWFLNLLDILLKE